MFAFLVCMIKGHKLEKFQHGGGVEAVRDGESITIPQSGQFSFVQPDYWLLTISDVNGDIRHLHPCSRCGMPVIFDENKKITGLRPFTAAGGKEQK